MKIIIEAEPKEIAALVVAIQERQSLNISTNVPDCNPDNLIVENNQRGKFAG